MFLDVLLQSSSACLFYCIELVYCLHEMTNDRKTDDPKTGIIYV